VVLLEALDHLELAADAQEATTPLLASFAPLPAHLGQP